MSCSHFSVSGRLLMSPKSPSRPGAMWDCAECAHELNETDLLITIRTGNYGTLERVLSFANTLFRELEEAEAKSGLPERVDRARVSATIAAATNLLSRGEHRICNPDRERQEHKTIRSM
jgi:hypothetical protein